MSEVVSDGLVGALPPWTSGSWAWLARGFAVLRVQRMRMVRKRLAKGCIVE